MTIALLPGQLVGTAPVALYTAPGPAKVVSAIAMNPTEDATTATMVINRADGSVVPVLTGLVLAGRQAHVVTELMGQSLAAGDAISAMARSDGSVNITLAVST